MVGPEETAAGVGANPGVFGQSRYEPSLPINTVASIGPPVTGQLDLALEGVQPVMSGAVKA